MVARPQLQDMRIEGRRAKRIDVSFRSELREAGKPSVPIHIVDVSPLGFRARCESCVVGGTVQVTLPGVGPISARVVWALGGRIGGEFAQPLEPDLYHWMLYAAPEQSSWHD